MVGRGRVQAVAEQPRDVEALEAVLQALEEPVVDELEAQLRISTTLRDRLGCSFAGVWMPYASGEFVLRAVIGELAQLPVGGEVGLRASAFAGA